VLDVKSEPGTSETPASTINETKNPPRVKSEPASSSEKNKFENIPPMPPLGSITNVSLSFANRVALVSRASAAAAAAAAALESKPAAKPAVVKTVAPKRHVSPAPVDPENGLNLWKKRCLNTVERPPGYAFKSYIFLYLILFSLISFFFV
jgi:hypothetical protein